MPGSTVRILFVEDEPLIRMIVAQELSAAGFEVHAVASGEEAAEIIRSAAAEFSLLVTDIQMPGRLDGIEVARLMRNQRPGAPVVYTTGRPDMLAMAGPLGQHEVLLPKPFAPPDLVRVVRRLFPEC
jgi:CheY-like chemotaxis protein